MKRELLPDVKDPVAYELMRNFSNCSIPTAFSIRARCWWRVTIPQNSDACRSSFLGFFPGFGDTGAPGAGSISV